MKTEKLCERDIRRAVQLLKGEELVAFPTETVYGLGAPLFSHTALQKIFRAKGRPSDNPLIAHICSLAQMEQIAAEIPKEAYLLAEAFFPGPLTLILPKKPHVPAVACANLPTVALRMPAHPIAQALIQAFGEPIAAPSANLSGRPSATTAEHVLDDFNGIIAAVIDGGATKIGIESTVVKCEPDRVLILRPGFVTAEQIEGVLKKPAEQYIAAKGEKPQSPGQKYRHYAPHAKVILATALEQIAQFRKESIKQSIVLDVSPSNLYDRLRRADKDGCDEILILCDQKVTSDLALMNRLSRAAE